jgi:hypothetical protein
MRSYLEEKVAAQDVSTCIQTVTFLVPVHREEQMSAQCQNPEDCSCILNGVLFVMEYCPCTRPLTLPELPSQGSNGADHYSRGH